MRIQNCKNNFLSRVANEILLKAVVQAIPAYCMSISRVAKEILLKVVAQAIPAYCMSVLVLPVS